VERRKRWISEIGRRSGDFAGGAERLAGDLADERMSVGFRAVIDHLRLCGANPEAYGYNTSEEKLYSKYTDAVLAAPLHHMHARRSQIYFQAVKRHVLILSYSHMAVLVGLVREADQRAASDALGGLLGSVRVMSASRDARSHWAGINRTLLCSDAAVNRLWCAEMTAAEEALSITKAEALTYLAAERKRISGLSREEAISRLLASSNVVGRSARVGKLRSSSLLTAA